jgi:hypothetical protein
VTGRRDAEVGKDGLEAHRAVRHDIRPSCSDPSCLVASTVLSPSGPRSGLLRGRRGAADRRNAPSLMPKVVRTSRVTRQTLVLAVVREPETLFPS